MPIPKILHQMWRDESIPVRWEQFRATWIHHHPDWEIRFWTDATLRRFIDAEHPDFLGVYDGYPSPIMRADAARYLLLEHFGGVYADLDFECLRPFDPLLENESLLLPLEPDVHLSSTVSTAAGMRRIIGNAWMASEPRHPFWRQVKAELVRQKDADTPLSATGPFMLSAVVDATSGFDCHPKLLPSETVHPASNLDLEWLAMRTPGSSHSYGPETYAIHYWDGTWWRKEKTQSRIYLLRSASPVIAGVWDEAKVAAIRQRTENNPLVSCLMVTGKRRRLAALATEAFRRQTYPHRELVVIDDSGLGVPDSLAEDDDSGRIRWIEVPAEGKPLGALRNLALNHARGELQCQWDDDDLSSPARIARQVDALYATGADACGLTRLQLWWPSRDWIALSSSRIWECALMWRKGTIAAYPELRAGEDSPPVEELAARGRIVMLEAPGLYTYVCHGGNTFNEKHWLSLWAAGGQRLEGAACRMKLRAMQVAIPAREYLDALDLPPLNSCDPSTSGTAATAKIHAHPPNSTIPDKPVLPKILVATPIKNAVPYLTRFFENLLHTDYPAEKLSLALLASDSQDRTVALTEQLLNRHSSRFASTRLIQRDFNFHLAGERWARTDQRRRRTVLAQSRNALLEASLQDEQWVLWIDVDVYSWPRDVIHQLLQSGHPLVAPHCVKGVPGGPSFDLDTFVYEDENLKDSEDHLLDGIFQPPRGVNRRYLDSFRDQEEVEVDSLGGTMLLVDAGLYRDGLRCPSRPYEGYLEMEGLARMARGFGVRPRALPKVEIVHP